MGSAQLPNSCRTLKHGLNSHLIPDTKHSRFNSGRTAPANIRLGRDNLVLRLSEPVSLVHHVADGAREIQVVVDPPGARHVPASPLKTNQPRNGREQGCPSRALNMTETETRRPKDASTHKKKNNKKHFEKNQNWREIFTGSDRLQHTDADSSRLPVLSCQRETHMKKSATPFGRLPNQAYARESSPRPQQPTRGGSGLAETHS